MDPSIPSGSSKRYIIVFIVVMAAVVLIGAGVFWYFKYFKVPAAESGAQSWDKNLKGTVYLTLARKSDPKSDAQLFAVDLGSPDRQPRQVLRDDNLNISEHISPDGLFGVYSGMKKGEGVFQLYKLDLKTRAKKQITKSQTLRKRGSEWSPDGKLIAFMAQPSGNASTTKEAGKWSVFTTDLDGKERLISGGIYPQWFPDGQRLLISKEDGLYLCVLASAKCERLLDLASYSLGWLNAKIDLARDGKTIVYASPDRGEVVLATIFSLDPLKAGISKIIKSSAFWPVFSEDGRYLIAEEVTGGVVNDKMDPHLVVYKLETMEKTILMRLGDFLQEKMFITDWRY